MRRRAATMLSPGFGLAAGSEAKPSKAMRSAVAALCRRVGRLPGDDCISLPLLADSTWWPLGHALHRADFWRPNLPALFQISLFCSYALNHGDCTSTRNLMFARKCT